jgi:hypothetical protein
MSGIRRPLAGSGRDCGKTAKLADGTFIGEAKNTYIDRLSYGVHISNV